MSPSRLWRVLAVLALFGAALLLWVLSLSRLDVSYAYPVACSSALLVTVFGVLFLHEAVTVRMWLGSALIVLGTILLVPPAEPRKDEGAARMLSSPAAWRADESVRQNTDGPNGG